MNGLNWIGRFLFSAAMVAFGAQYIYYAAGGRGAIPGPPWIPEASPVAWLAGIGFVFVGVCISAGKMAQGAAILLGVAFLLRVLMIHLPGLVTHTHDPGQWTPLFEVMAMGGGAWILAKSLPAGGTRSRERNSRVLETAFQIGRLLFALSLVVFGVQHFMYAAFIATLIPGWIPGHLFWAYFIGVVFFCAALSIGTGVMARLVEILLGTMFFLWVVLLHAPRVVHASRHGNEWTSLFIALAMSGVAFALAGEADATDE